MAALEWSRALKGHVVVEAVEHGWERLANGALLDTAEAAGFRSAAKQVDNLPSAWRRGDTARINLIEGVQTRARCVPSATRVRRLHSSS